MDKANKAKVQKSIRQANVLETLKDIGSSAASTVKTELFEKTSHEFVNQLFGRRYPDSKKSGEIAAGETLEMSEVFSGKRESEEKLRKQLTFERRLRQEDQSLIETNVNQLKLQLHAITEEVVKIAKITPDLAQQVEIAAIQAPVNPGIYHLFFFEKLLDFIKGFRQKMNDATSWLTTVNNKAVKKNYWGLYKKHGSKFLLSPDHFLQRSAG